MTPTSTPNNTPDEPDPFDWAGMTGADHPSAWPWLHDADPTSPTYDPSDDPAAWSTPKHVDEITPALRRREVWIFYGYNEHSEWVLCADYLRPDGFTSPHPLPVVAHSEAERDTLEALLRESPGFLFRVRHFRELVDVSASGANHDSIGGVDFAPLDAAAVRRAAAVLAVDPADLVALALGVMRLMPQN